MDRFLRVENSEREQRLYRNGVLLHFVRIGKQLVEEEPPISDCHQRRRQHDGGWCLLFSFYTLLLEFNHKQIHHKILSHYAILSPQCCCRRRRLLPNLIPGVVGVLLALLHLSSHSTTSIPPMAHLSSLMISIATRWILWQTRSSNYVCKILLYHSGIILFAPFAFYPCIVNHIENMNNIGNHDKRQKRRAESTNDPWIYGGKSGKI